MSRTKAVIYPLLLVLPLAISLPGCNTAENEMTNTEPVPAATTAGENAVGANTPGDNAAGLNAIDSPSTMQQPGPLGNERPAGPFVVTLTTAKTPPEVGNTVFTARVTREGQPVREADVRLMLSMPDHGMEGPETTLKSTGPVYTGTAPLSMAGEWQAVVTVSSGGEIGNATYVFNVPG